jgi:hypothetical protein
MDEVRHMDDKNLTVRASSLVVPFAIILVLVGGGLYVAFQVTVSRYSSLGSPGEPGDLFGAANALFSGLALIGVVWAVFIQNHQLRIQIIDLVETTKELRRQTQLESILRVLEYVHLPESRRVRFFMFRKDKELRSLIASVGSEGAWHELDEKVNELFRDPNIGGGIQWQQIEVTLKMTDEVAHLIKDGHAPYDPLAEKLIANEFVRWWYIFEPYIRHRRDRADLVTEPKERPPYCSGLKWLVAVIEGRIPYAPFSGTH